MKKGFLIVFEGIDGSGKTTQATKLFNALLKSNYPVYLSAEPTTDSIYGRRLREAIKNKVNCDPKVITNWFLNDRFEHVQNFIEPLLEKGFIIILDRYYFSNIAYQGAMGIDPFEIKSMNESIAPIPDIVFIIEVLPELGLSRIKGKKDMFEELDNLVKVDKIYKSLDDDYIYRVDGFRNENLVHKEILDKTIGMIGDIKDENKNKKDF